MYYTPYIFDSTGVLRCAWCGKKLEGTMHVEYDRDYHKDSTSGVTQYYICDECHKEKEWLNK